MPEWPGASLLHAVLLPRIQSRNLAIESAAVNGVELRAIDTPLFWRYLEPGENRGQAIVDVPALVAANDTTGPVDQGQVVLEAERNAGLAPARGVVVELQQRF